MKKLILMIFLLSLMIGCGGGGTLEQRKTLSVEVNQTKESIKESKDFFNELRVQTATLIGDKSKGNRGFLTQETNHLGKALKSVVSDIEYVSNYSGQILKAIKDNKTDSNITVIEQATGQYYKTYKYSLKEANHEYNGTLSVLNFTDLNLADRPIPVKINGNFPKIETNGTITTQQFKIDADVESNESVTVLDFKNMSIKSRDVDLTLDGFDLAVSYEIINNKPKNVISKLKTVLINGTTNGYKIGGSLKIDENDYIINPTYTKNEGFIPKKIFFNGSILGQEKDWKISGYTKVELKNAVDMNFSSDNKEEVLKVDISADIDIQNRPLVKTTIHYDTDADSISEYNIVNFFYTYGDKEIASVAKFDKSWKAGTVTLSSSTKIATKLYFVNGKIFYRSDSYVTKDAKMIGKLVNRLGTPAIKYVDGTVESLL